MATLITHVVTGAAVVLRTLSSAGGGEQYLYKGAPIVDGVYRQDSLKHAEDIGLIEAVPEPEPTPEEVAAAEAEQRAAADAQAAADKKAAEDAAAAAKKAAGAKSAPTA